MAEPFDPYHVWLGIPPEEQPPHHYRLLGIPVFEASAQVIALASQRQMAHVKAFAIGPYGDLSQKILNELARARVCLMDPARKQQYDAALRARLQRSEALASDRAAASKPPPLPTGLPGGAAGSDPRGVPRPPEIPLPWPETIPRSDVRLVRIGRAPDNEIVLDYPMVSAHHAVIRIEAGTVMIEDLESTNGLAIGEPDNKIARARLSAGDVVYFGSHAVRAVELLAEVL